MATRARPRQAGEFGYLWLYFTAPVLGMLTAVEMFRLVKLGRGWFCAKLNHVDGYRCIHCVHEPGRAHQGTHCRTSET